MDARVDRLSEALSLAVVRVLRALTRVLLRHGMSYPAFEELAKRAYVDVALREFAIPGRKPSQSRAALLTGLTRKEVQRLAEGLSAPEGGSAPNRAARVVAGWVRDGDFHDAAGQPRALDLDGGPASFAGLVRRYSGDVPPRAVLDELVRVGMARRDEAGRVALLSRVYIPHASDVGKLAILGADVALLIATIDHNLQNTGGPARFQRKVVYDNLPREAMEEFRQLTARHAQELIELLDAWLSRHDRDANPAVRGEGRVRAGVGVFAFEEDLGDAPGGNP